jgi:hypothetical protein
MSACLQSGNEVEPAGCRQPTGRRISQRAYKASIASRGGCAPKRPSRPTWAARPQGGAASRGLRPGVSPPNSISPRRLEPVEVSRPVLSLPEATRSRRNASAPIGHAGRGRRADAWQPLEPRSCRPAVGSPSTGPSSRAWTFRRAASSRRSGSVQHPSSAATRATAPRRSLLSRGAPREGAPAWQLRKAPTWVRGQPLDGDAPLQQPVERGGGCRPRVRW